MNSLYTPNHKLKLEATLHSSDNNLRTHVPRVAVPSCVDINTLCSDSKWPERITTPTLREPSISFTLKLELTSPTASTVERERERGGWSYNPINRIIITMFNPRHSERCMHAQIDKWHTCTCKHQALPSTIYRSLYGLHIEIYRRRLR